MKKVRCASCGKIKSILDFHKRQNTKRGVRSDCKNCRREKYFLNPLPDKLRANRHYYRNYEKHREQAREWEKKNKKLMTKYKLDWRRKHPNIARAHWAINNAIRSNKIKRERCIKCGKIAHAHHPDYDKPLKIIWLCPKHHSQLSRKYVK